MSDAGTDARADARAGVELDPHVLDDWIGDRLPGAGSALSAVRLGEGSGIANALFIIERGGRRWVLRRPPAIKNHPSAADTKREWRILNALEGTPVPHPAPVLFCEDVEVIGAPFMIMSIVEGFTPGVAIPDWITSDPKALFEIGMAYVDGIVALSGVDWVAGGLEGLGKPDGFLERQVARWRGQLDGYRVRELPEEAFLCEWLEANRPAMSPAAIMHGDYSPFNVMVANDLPVRLAAIVDWDTGTIGDPLLDLGHLLARWVEPGERGPLDSSEDMWLEGYPTRAEMGRRYGEATGRDLTALAYYEALSLFKLGVILEGNYARARRAGVPDEDNRMFTGAPRLFEVAAEFAPRHSTMNAPAQPSLQELRRSYTRREISREAMRLFAERGFDAVTVEDIAAEVGMSARTFFRYFAGKDDVVLRYQRRLQARLVAVFEAHAGHEPPITALRNAYVATSVVAPEDRTEFILLGRFLMDSQALLARSRGEHAARNDDVVAVLAERLGIDAGRNPLAETIASAMSARLPRPPFIAGWPPAGAVTLPRESGRHSTCSCEDWGPSTSRCDSPHRGSPPALAGLARCQPGANPTARGQPPPAESGPSRGSASGGR